MEKAITLTRNGDYKRIYNRGKSSVGSFLVTYAAKKSYGEIRFGITTSKKVGKAVDRNRARRVIRESFRLLEGEIAQPVDLVFVARSRACHVKCQAVQKEMKKQLIALGIIK